MTRFVSDSVKRYKNFHYVESSRNFFTLCIVTRAVGEDEIIIMGWLWPVVVSLDDLYVNNEDWLTGFPSQ